MSRFKANLNEILRGDLLPPPSYEQLGVPPVKQSPVRSVPESVPLTEYVAGLHRLEETLALIEKMDLPMAKRLVKALDNSKVILQRTLNLNGGAAPQLISQVIHYTPNGILVADDSFSQLPADHRSDAILYALLTAALPDDERSRAKAWEFHLAILALVREGKPNLVQYLEAKRTFCRSVQTDTLIRLRQDFQAYCVRWKERYDLGSSSQRVLDQMNVVSFLLAMDIQEGTAADHQNIFVCQPIPVTGDLDSNAQVRYRLWSIMEKTLTTPSTAETQEKLKVVLEAAEMAMDGRLRSSELEKITASAKNSAQEK